MGVSGLNVGYQTITNFTSLMVSRQSMYLPIAFVSSLLALRIENLNFALTSLLLQASKRRYNDK